MTKILWMAIPAVFILAVSLVFLGPPPPKNPEVKVRQIVVKADPRDPDDIERARKKIEDIYSKLQRGADFASIAKLESEAPNSSESGDMGWLGRGILPKPMEDVAFQLVPGQQSEILEDGSGGLVVYRILYVEQRRNF